MTDKLVPTTTVGYYNDRAEQFFSSTLRVDMGPIYERFLDGLAPGASILDAGCGSGRDARAFAERGFSVSAFDASVELAKRASEHCGFAVDVRRFEDVDEVAQYDAIWCCASLLHVPLLDMPSVLSKLWAALKAGGRIYVSYKLGSGEREHDGRRFTDADENTVRAWLGAMPELLRMEFWQTQDQRPDRTESWTNALVHRSTGPDKRLVTGGDDHFLQHLSAAFAQSNQADLAVAFVKTTGLRLLLPDLRAMAEAGDSHRVRMLTSDYLDITDPEALRLLILLQESGAEVRVFTTQNNGSFHLKAYVFARTEAGQLNSGTAFIGSSNISKQALRDGLEWNYRVVFPQDTGYLEARERFEELFAHPKTIALTDSWIEAYEQRRLPPSRSVAPGSHEQEAPPQPNDIQLEALTALAETRENGYRRGLVVLATGLGKTWLAAFDAVRMGARRILFVAHREEILSQAAATFIRILPGKRVGSYTGRSRDGDVDVLCASVQTLGKAAHLERFAPQHFDYIVVDEFHHAAAATYKRLLAHFAPSFLLGLTATPDRTDQSDILSLCDDNLVFGCNLFAGITSGLLAPFHYYGIHDESVDYKEVPWRNGRFDPEELSNKLATLARARHALTQWRVKAQKRTLAFCVSTRHADYMADQFSRAGVSAAAVYAGSTLGRGQALEKLEDGSLQVVFSVDLFNEGVDLPSIDTVLLLRPTESKILFLQQLGRGLRRHEGKQQLVVLDFIGNHQAFLGKPQALFGVGATYKALAQFGRQVEKKELTLPNGCYVNYDLSILDFLKSLDGDGTQKDYEALRAVLGRRPTLSEFYRSGSSMQDMRRREGHWYALVQSMGDLTQAESAVTKSFQALLREVETTAMTKSFKAVTLEAWLEQNGLHKPVPLEALASHSRAVLERRRPLLSDLDASMRNASPTDSAWQRYWLENPVKAWTGGNLQNRTSALFELQGSSFALKQPVTDTDAVLLADMLQELVDYRLAAYEVRKATAEPGSNVIPFPVKQRETVELPFFPNLKIACGHFKTGRADAEEHLALPPSYGTLDPSRHFIARASGNSMNGGKQPVRDGDYLLLELITPSRAGSITGSVMAIERQDDSGDNQYLLRVVTKNREGQYILKANNPDYEDLPATDEMRTLARLRNIIDPLDLAIGESFMREDIPTLFGESFNPGNWHAGHVVLAQKKAHILLVTLNKQGKADEHKYMDHWVDDTHFHWQSQNATDPSGKRGQEIIRHAALGIDIHLFVRENKLAAGKAAPFNYHGRVLYESHQGSKPMSVVFRLQS
jgi:superfamily II DNA or RNA helicase/SAM-dependent methyltransferase/SOS-response transcriptional repressor LexA